MASGLLDIAMPRLSDQMEEATVLQWLKGPGDTVARGEPLVEVETDKTAVEMEALQSGTLAEIVAEVGDEVAVGAVIGYIESAD